ncbi:MAG: PAS domain-containing protein [Nitrospirae bacterium]|nr:PAS domain-containing protein [Nitrospirota bacterium]
MDVQHIQFLLLTAISLLILLIMFFIIRNLLGYHKKKTEQEQKDATQVGFVVDTFHELVSKLKEKERELEGLKSRAEERASSIEVYNENIFQSVPSGVVSFGQDLRITRMNSAALRILGLREEVLGKDHAEVFQSPLREMIAGRTIMERAETAYTDSSGRRLWIGLALSPLKDRSGSVIGHLLVFTDLTELKAFQSQNELRDRLSTLGEMSAGIAHELRNPMGVISGYTKILSRKVDEPLRPAVEAIAREIDVMNRIITDFLTFARPAEPVFGSVDLGALVTGSAEMLDNGPHKVVVRADTTCLPVIRADEVMIRQAMTNLIQNAAEAMPEGGEIRIACAMNGEKLVLSIADTGHGIPESIRDRIFLPFYTTKERGTGLGLAIVHNIIVSHGGSIRAESSPEGTVFYITLPKEMILKSA